MAVYWGIQGTGPNENVSKLETDRQTKSQRLWKKKKTDRQMQTKMKKGGKRVKNYKKNNREPLVSETMTFLPIESDA